MQGLFVTEDERLVRRVEVDLVELCLSVEIDTARLHEPQRAIDLSGEGFVAKPFGARVEELEVPCVGA